MKKILAIASVLVFLLGCTSQFSKSGMETSGSLSFYPPKGMVREAIVTEDIIGDASAKSIVIYNTTNGCQLAIMQKVLDLPPSDIDGVEHLVISPPIFSFIVHNVTTERIQLNGMSALKVVHAFRSGSAVFENGTTLSNVTYNGPSMTIVYYVIGFKKHAAIVMYATPQKCASVEAQINETIWSIREIE